MSCGREISIIEVKSAGVSSQGQHTADMVQRYLVLVVKLGNTRVSNVVLKAYMNVSWRAAEAWHHVPEESPARLLVKVQTSCSRDPSI